MNRFGTNYIVQVLGSSHGDLVGVVIEGIPVGVEIDVDNIQLWLSRRRPGQSSITTPRDEKDIVEIKSGLFNGKTNGQPLLAYIQNSDKNSSHYETIKNTPRPGHADYPAHIKYKGSQDYRGGGSFSGRMTIALIIAGAIAKQIIESNGIMSFSFTKEIGGIEVNSNSDSFEKVYENPTRTLNSSDSVILEEEILSKKSEGDSVGGIVECQITNLPVGVGEPFFDSIESRISHMIFSIPSVKGIEFGSGFNASKMTGSSHNDEYSFNESDQRIITLSNNAGGILGGLSNGMPIVFRVAVKPTSSILKQQNTVDISTNKQTTLVVKGRHDPCIVPRVVPVIECATACVILDLLLMGNFITI